MIASVKEEELDVLAWDSGEKTTGSISRKIAHQKGIAHAAIHIWIVARFNDELHLVLQKRAWDKPNFPGLLDATVGGHLRAGETVLDALRETEEEIGIRILPNELHFLERHQFVLTLPGYRDYEWIEEYFVLRDDPLETYSFPDKEVIGLAAIAATELRKLLFEPFANVPAILYDGNSPPRKELIGRKHINPFYFSDGFFKRLLSKKEAFA